MPNTILVAFLGGLLSGLITLLTGTIVAEIEVAPQTLNLQNQGAVVTVHTDLPYSSVSSAEVWLEGQPIFFSKSDAQGYFVAKFEMEAIQGLDLDVGSWNELCMEGKMKNGDSFRGVDEVRVIDEGSGQ